MGHYKYIQNFSDGNLNYKDFTADEKLILTEVLEEQFGRCSCDLVQGPSDGHECGNEPAGFMKVANFIKCSATVTFSNTTNRPHA
jgi:hypothetical protein